MQFCEVSFSGYLTIEIRCGSWSVFAYACITELINRKTCVSYSKFQYRYEQIAKPVLFPVHATLLLITNTLHVCSRLLAIYWLFAEFSIEKLRLCSRELWFKVKRNKLIQNKEVCFTKQSFYLIYFGFHSYCQK